MKSWLIRKEPDVGKDWRQVQKGISEDEMVGWRHQSNGPEFEQTLAIDEGQGSRACCSSWGRWGSDTTEPLHFHFSLSYTGEGNGNPLQCSCLENPKDGGAWWPAVYGVAQSQTLLKRLSSSSSIGEIYRYIFTP